MRAMPTIGLLGDHRVDQIPASHRDLVQCPPVAALTTVMPDGSPQTSVVWCDFDGVCACGSTPCGLCQGAQHARQPPSHPTVLPPAPANRYLEVRGTVVEMTEVGAAGHLDALASKYAGRPVRYFGDAIPAASPAPSTGPRASGPPTSSPSTPAGSRDGDDHPVRARGAGDPGLAPGPVDPTDVEVLTTMDGDGQPGRAWSGSTGTAPAPRSTPPWSGTRAATW